MNGHQTELGRIQAEYGRRAREIPADRYAFSNPDNILRYVSVIRGAVELLGKAGMFPPAGLDILEVGCGKGDWLLDMVRWGADPERLRGIDLDAARVEEARRRMPAADPRAGDAARLPWEDGSFDLVTQFTVFSSILDAGLRAAVAAEMVRVLRPGGAILWYDLRWNNPANRQVIGLDRLAVRGLFPGCEVAWKSATLAPPVARVAARISWVLAELLQALPPLHSHALALIRRPAPGNAHV